MIGKVLFSVFTKPWRTLPLARLGEMVSGLGFDGIEFPLRPGYQVEPENVADLPRAALESPGQRITLREDPGLGLMNADVGVEEAPRFRVDLGAHPFPHPLDLIRQGVGLAMLDPLHAL